MTYSVTLCAAPEPRAELRTKLARQPPETRYQLSPNWRYGAQIELDVERTKNFDLDSSEDDDELVADPKFQFALSYDQGGWLSAFVDVELGKELLLDSPESRMSGSTRLELKEAWLEVGSVDRRQRLRLGRQDFEDERTWVVDEELDGARAYLTLTKSVLELSVTRNNLFERDLLNSTEDERTNNYLALLRFGGEDDDGMSLYALYRDSRKREGEDLLFAGLQSVGELTEETDYWLNVAGVAGDAQRNDVRGYGFDAGVVHTLARTLEPSVGLGLAYGSGDSNPDGRDRNFRQTGLQDNDAEISGVTDFKYYGHALNPELSNLLILTLDLGVRPTARSSFEVVYHYYRQDEALAELRDSNLDVDPNGKNKELGQALDFVFGYLAGGKLEFELVGGWFFPGSAFNNDASTAFFGGIELIYEF
jgi:alginate production protein